MTDTNNPFAYEDRAFLEEYGIGVEEALRQWSLLTNRPRRMLLERPCTISDGIEQLATGEHDELIQTHREAARQGRWLKFVPASGAASRMFSLESEDEKRRFCESLDQFAFAGLVRKRLSDRGFDVNDLVQGGRYAELIDAVVSPAGLGYGQLAKGLVEFHSYDGESLTPFEEHLLEAMACLADHGGSVNCHFTVAADQRGRFADRFRRFKLQRDHANCEVQFSVQHPSTDTIAMTEQGRLLRGAAGKPVLRPGGHGALIENVNDVHGDLILVKNIDNVGHEHARHASVAWMEIIGGYLVRLQDAVHHHLRQLQTADDGSLAAAEEFVRRAFPSAALPQAGDSSSLRTALTSQLKRPLRVCGMVRNEGEPGGGPFWVRQADESLSLQIVESAEVDENDAGQQDVLHRATHFNPVFMALSVRDELGEPFDLCSFVDENRAIITEKALDGQTATVLERPGLWNGAMARWNSVFVEVPIDVFSPVKNVLDLLRPPHQPPNARQSAGCA